MSTRLRFLVPAIAIALAACAGPRPPQPPAASIEPPQAWAGQLDGAEGRLASRWWEGFADPVLTRLIDTALARNTDIAIAAARIEELRAQAKAAAALQIPHIDLAAGAGPQRVVNAFGQGVSQLAGQAQVAVAYDLDLFQRLSSSTAAARATLLASEAAQDAVRLAVVASTANGYFALRTLDERLRVLEAAAQARAAAARLATRRAAAGYASRLDQRQAEAEVEAAAALIPATRLAIRRQEHALGLLLGEAPGSVERGRSLMELDIAPADPSVPSMLLRTRPDIFQSEQALVAADHRLDAARAAFLPSIRLTAQGGVMDSSTLANPVRVFALGGSILAPIFNRDRLTADAAAATARRDAAAFAYKKTVLTAFREVEDALAGIALSNQQADRLARQTSLLGSALTLAAERYREGYAPFLEQLDAQRACLAAELSLVQARGDVLAAHVHLFQALGGGWNHTTLPTNHRSAQ